MTASPEKAFPFLDLPLELREAIYSLYFKPADRLIHNAALEEQGFYGGLYVFDFNLYRASKQIHKEAQRVWQRENVFVKILTPWPSAGMYSVYLRAIDQRELVDFGSGPLNHVSSEGLVPIVCIDQRADKFNRHHAVVQISAPFHEAAPLHSVIVLLDDLHLFTQTWYYSALSYPMLNDRLHTTFVLRDPDKPSLSNDLQISHEDVSSVPLSLQRRLLLPFEQVKGLYSTDVYGYAPSVRTELKRLQDLPIPTLQASCESATALMQQGDAALSTAQDAQQALALYAAAFKAIHILIHGRTRRVLADVFFHDVISDGIFAGQTGMTVRVILRLRLVSRCVTAHLQLHNWEEAAYWGMRSIRIMREAMNTDFDNFVTEIVGGSDVGLIYVRTGVAVWQMEKDAVCWAKALGTLLDEQIDGSEKLWELSGRYIRSADRGAVRRELEGYGVPTRVLRLYADADGSGDTQSEGTTIAQAGSEED
ncbi:hypothetical protein ACN47E_000931 [Coniothyrium glycines]